MPTFPASERIKSKKLLDKVYQEGELIKHYPYRLKYLITTPDVDSNVQIVVSVPKRNVKLAVRRNRLKRQIKEAYRLNKKDLLSQFEEKEQGLALFLIYTGKEDQNFQLLEKKLKELLKKLQEKL